MKDKPADDARDVKDKPDKSDVNESAKEDPQEEHETVADAMTRHETLHGEHRSRIEAIEKHLGLGRKEPEMNPNKPNRERKRH